MPTYNCLSMLCTGWGIFFFYMTWGWEIWCIANKNIQIVEEGVGGGGGGGGVGMPGEGGGHSKD